MLDTHARKYIQPVITTTATFCLRMKLTANHVTYIGFFVGICAGLFVYFEQTVVALILLWLSGFLDAVDGTMARKTKPSAWGTFLDIGFDRLVEISIILGLAFRYPDSMWALLLLSVSIIYAMTVFLTVGALAEKSGMKSFYYQTGLGERTEGFILFSFMMTFTSYLTWFTLLFLAVEVFTTFQRIRDAKRILQKIDRIK
ncbi:CDP-alcohol phosphatidyltransferase family protein [Metabacillus iocasae]|uniref:Phosphatidylglycerophosphate synthase n=1 Tax=Priestia iocasae TaxID=2291674 RepID=A0ABS2QSJ5_9BACI|nr:CDP-alcohol phosphatidyltransferase family protein [Metabacillus iocasae]MBM7702433.1 phosphatidylglycerophosphate synthase [Metabacillus iocasae]